MTGAERRSARLLFAEELALGELAGDALDREEVLDAVREMAVPSPLARRLQARALARGRLTYAGDVAAPMQAARRAVLGEDRAAGRPRVLLRLDAFPAPGVTPDGLAAVHAALHAAQVPYLLTVVAEELDLAGQVVLRRLSDDGVAFALRPRAHGGDLATRLDDAAGALRTRALRAEVLACAEGTLSATDLALAAGRFDVVAGGPDDVRRLGFHRTPLWRGEAVWLPAYAPLAGDADPIVAAVAALTDRGAALWTPALAGLASLAADEAATRRLAHGLAGCGRPWAEFLAAVRATT